MIKAIRDTRHGGWDLHYARNPAESPSKEKIDYIYIGRVFSGTQPDFELPEVQYDAVKLTIYELHFVDFLMVAPFNHDYLLDKWGVVSQQNYIGVPTMEVPCK